MSVEISGTEPQWYGHAAHFICGADCRFHLATTAGPFMVSTVGELWPDSGTRRITAGCRDADWYARNSALKGDNFDAAYRERFGFEEIGYERKYETMVFRLNGDLCDCGCGLPRIDPTALDFEGYNDALSARAGHMRLLAKWQATASRGSTDEPA